MKQVKMIIGWGFLLPIALLGFYILGFFSEMVRENIYLALEEIIEEIKDEY
jgi:hypothetical protein